MSMQPVEITFFSVTLFFALAVLITWKRRRDILNARLNKGLRGFVSGGARPQQAEETEGEELITA